MYGSIHRSVLFVPVKVPMYDRATPTSETLKRVTVVLPLDLHKALKLRGIELDITMNDQIIAAVQMYLSKYGSEKNNLDD